MAGFLIFYEISNRFLTFPTRNWVNSGRNRPKFKISKHAMHLASDQDNENVINTDLPYGETYKIGKKRKKTDGCYSRDSCFGVRTSPWIRSLSAGGMQQRVGLARAVTADPDILLMDEPFGSIDAQTRLVMQEELLRIWSETRKTVMFVTHDLDEAVMLADRVAVLSPGPGKVQDELIVDMPRPRWEYDLRAHPRFAEIRATVWDLIRQDTVSQPSAAEDT